MTAFPGAEQPRGPESFVPEQPEMGLFARVEGLIGEEDALLRIPAQERSAAQHERLRALAEELDRVFGELRERARRLGARPHATGA